MSQGLLLQDLHVQHPGSAAPALCGVTVHAARAELVALLGPSGCGKSTLLRVAAGLQPLQAGQVWLNGACITHTPAAQRPVSLVFQQYALFPHLSVLANVAYGLQAAGVGDTSAHTRALAALALVGLGDQAALHQRSPVALSGGQQQRVALARALALEPAVLLLDEPLSNLDDSLRRQVRDDIRALQQRLALTVLYVTHDQAEAMAVADRITLLQAGRVVQSGSPREVYETPANAWVAGFMGDALLLPLRVGADGRAWLGPLQVLLPAPSQPATCWQALVRPHAWLLGPAHTPGLPARVLRSADLGRLHEYTLASSLGELRAVCPRTPRRHENGAPLSLKLNPSGVVVMPGDAAR
jgi:iron(III) transport system ATP-binding protein